MFEDFNDENSEDFNEKNPIKDIDDGTVRIRPPSPPTPPTPPPPPKVIGIRGLDQHFYNKIGVEAKKLNIRVSDLINDIFRQYFDKKGGEEDIIRGLDTLNISSDDLAELGLTSFRNIEILLFGQDITIEAFKKVKELRNINKIFVPPHLYIPLLKKIEKCGKIEKYRGEAPSNFIHKEFHSDITLPRDFFQYFIENDEKVILISNCDLEVEDDVTLKEWEVAVHSLTCHGDIKAPLELRGWIYTRAEAYSDVDFY